MKAAGGSVVGADATGGNPGASGAGGGGTLPHVDPETQARLEALLEAAGIANLGGESKQLTDPEVIFLFQFYRGSHFD